MKFLCVCARLAQHMLNWKLVVNEVCICKFLLSAKTFYADSSKNQQQRQGLSLSLISRELKRENMSSSSSPHGGGGGGNGSEKEENSSRPRFFNTKAKSMCWAKAETVPGRHPERWRKDAAGNVVCKRFFNCLGCLCFEYDHIIPYSKGFPPCLLIKFTLKLCLFNISAFHTLIDWLFFSQIYGVIVLVYGFSFFLYLFHLLHIFFPLNCEFHLF